MKKRKIIAVIAVCLCTFTLFITVQELFDHKESWHGKFYVGVELAYGDFEDYRFMVNEVKKYTNLVVIGSPEISLNQTLLNEICDYIYGSGLNFIVLFTSPIEYLYNPYVWIIKAREKYGEKFLGVYRIDEPGGKQVDNDEYKFVVKAGNFTEAANTYVEILYAHLEYYIYSGAKVFTSDYALYWFDYKSGYDCVLTQFGWNHSKELHTALCRGAAKVQDKEWGVIITWKYNNMPFIESGEEMYNDMVVAYHAGANYVVIFNYPKVSRFGVLTEEHLVALKRFWEYINLYPERYGMDRGCAVYVLPESYGFGFRNMHDNLWGLWYSDGLSEKVWSDLRYLLSVYGLSLDVVYCEKEFLDVIKGKYDKVFFWNETIR
jgi:hypothetical protein